MNGQSTIRRRTTRRAFDDSTHRRKFDDSTGIRRFDDSTGIRRLDGHSTIRRLDEHSTIRCSDGNSTTRRFNGQSTIRRFIGHSTIRRFNRQSTIQRAFDRGFNDSTGIRPFDWSALKIHCSCLMSTWLEGILLCSLKIQRLLNDIFDDSIIRRSFQRFAHSTRCPTI